jgi:DNA-binding NtrC family response regulator
MQNENRAIRTQGKRISLANENPLLFQWLRTMPQSRNLVIDIVRDLEECLDILSRHMYELIFTDADTEGATRVPLWKEIRQLQPDAKVIVVTCKSTTSDILEAI